MTTCRLVGVLGVLAALASCSAGPADTTAVEKNVASSIKGPGSVQVDAVDCPRDVVPEAGRTFSCPYVLTDGSAGLIEVTLQDEDGTGSWKVTRPASGQAEQLVLTDYEKKAGRKPSSVECPDTLREGPKSVTICTIRFANGESRDVSVTYEGARIRWRTR